MELKHNFLAPWGKTLRLMSAASALLVIAVFFILALSFSAALTLGLLCLLIAAPLLILALAALFMVRSYSIESGKLNIDRPFWKDSYPLEELESIEIDPQAMEKSLRIFGNGGMFSFTGIFLNKRLGRYRSFANDPARSVVLRFSDRTIVVSPDKPEHFRRVLQDAQSAARNSVR